VPTRARPAARELCAINDSWWRSPGNNAEPASHHQSSMPLPGD
jgi:hypothetical protein